MTRSAEQTTSAVWRGAVRGGIDSISRAAIEWKSRVLLAISLTLVVLSCIAFDSATLRDRLPVVLLAMAAGILVASLVLSRLCMGRCVSCGRSPTDLVWRLDDCPVCHGSYCGAADLLAGNSVLSLQDCLSGRRVPLVTMFGVVLTLALRDRASRIRLVGGKVYDQAECPWATPCGSWSIWITVNGTDYEMLPPPHRFATGMFEMLRETYRKLEKETPNGPARLPLALDDWSETVQLVIEESDKERAASILFAPGPREPVGTAGSRLRELFFPPGLDRAADATPPATTWTRLPRFVPVIPRRALIAVNSIAAILVVGGYVAMFLTGMDSQSLPFGVMTVSSLFLLPGAILLAVRRECRCGALLAQLSDDRFPIWCPECRSVFDPSKRGLPMDGSTLRLDDLEKCQDPHAVWLVPLLDYALDCRKELVTFIGGDSLVAARLSKADTETVELPSIDSWLCLELMAEVDRRARARTGGDVASFRIIGSLREASATLELSNSEGKRVVTLNLDYGTRCRS